MTDIVKKFNSIQSSTEKKFSILIPSWNNLPFLKLCVESIKKNSFHQHQIIVFINDGDDGSLDWVKQQKDIDYLHSKTNIGICYALNSCRSLIKCNYILYINDDMYVCPNWDKYLTDEIATIGHNNFFLSSTAIEPVSSFSNCTIVSDFGTDVKNFEEARLLKEFENFEKHDWQGSTWPPCVVHISLWDLVGGYSIEFSPGMYSDPDFAMKLWQSGVRYFKGLGKSRVYHFGSKSVTRIKKNKGYYTFITKWGMTSSTLTKQILHRGGDFNGILPDAKLPLSTRIKSVLKRSFIFNL